MKLKYKFDDNDYEYEINDKIKNEELLYYFMKEFNIIRSVAEDIIDEFELWKKLEERYEDDLTSDYYDEAFEQYKEDEKYDKDPEDFYGVSRKYD